MSLLVIAEHDNAVLKTATLNAVTAAAKIGGEIHILVAGSNCGAVAEQAAKVAGVAKVKVADAAQYGDQTAENLAALIVANAAGYATFRKIGLKIGMVGGGAGRGLAVDKGGKQTYMAFAEVSAGPGLGIKTFDLIFVFDDQQAMSNFINKGWEYTGEATAAAKYEDSGSAMTMAQSVSPGVRLYQVTSSGLSAEITIKGTKYFKDSKLNK